MPYKTQATQALYAWDYGLGGVEGGVGLKFSQKAVLLHIPWRGQAHEIFRIGFNMEVKISTRIETTASW
jgi:hypothetical protein